jgi:predicted MFS family arabinose efflux permease
MLPLVTLPLAALFLYLTVSTADAYAAIAALCLGFACVELNEGNYWCVAMRLAPDDAMAATAVLNTGGNLGGVLGTALVAALSAEGRWDLVFTTGVVTSVVAALLWLTIDPERGDRT